MKRGRVRRLQVLGAVERLLWSKGAQLRPKRALDSNGNRHDLGVH